MNLRHFSIALLISALPLKASTFAGSFISFDHGDFISSKPTIKNGEPHLKVKLSKSGKAKLKKLQA